MRLTIAPSRPAPPHFEPPPSWGRVRGVGPAAQRGMLAAYLPAIPLQGLIDFQPTRCQALFSSLCCTAWGLKGLFRLGRDEAYKILSRVIHPGQSCSGTSIRAAELLGTTEVSAGMGQKIWEAAQSTYPTTPGVELMHMECQCLQASMLTV